MLVIPGDRASPPPATRAANGAGLRAVSVAAVAVAAGPLIGGWVTTEHSWRYVFAGETVVVIGIPLPRGICEPRSPSGAPGSTSSARPCRAGSADRVRDPRSSVWGPSSRGRRRPSTHGGHAVDSRRCHSGARRPALLERSSWEQRQPARRDQLLDTTLLRAGAAARRAEPARQQLVLMGTFFIIPYPQVVLGLDA